MKKGSKHTELSKEKIGARTRGKTLEEIYGEKKAKDIKDKISKNSYSSRFIKGKNWEEIYGVGRATEMRKESSIAVRKRKKRDGYLVSKAGRERIKTFMIGRYVGRIISEKQRKQISKFHKELWKNISYRKKMIPIIIKNGLIRSSGITSYEKKISELCIRNNLPFIYCGGGTFLIGNKSPDFVSKKNKIVIEVYHSYWKIKDYGSCKEYEKQRSEYFAKYGYKTIFIRGPEMRGFNWEKKCLSKISYNLK